MVLTRIIFEGLNQLVSQALQFSLVVHGDLIRVVLRRSCWLGLRGLCCWGGILWS